MPDVVLEQADAVINGHLEDFRRTQIGQTATGLIDRFEFLTLDDFVGNVADRHNQLRGSRVIL